MTLEMSEDQGDKGANKEIGDRKGFMDLKEIRELLKLMEKFGVSDLSLSRGESRVRLRRAGSAQESAYAPVRQAPQPPPQQAGAPSSAPGKTAPSSGETLAVRDNQFLVTSPIVGTFYRAPSPESPSYVEVGDTVSKGKVLCIVEAMKIMNEIESPVAGIVREICAKNGKPIEFGQVLFRIEVVSGKK